VPISQLGMFATLILSSQFPGQHLKLLGYRPTDEDVVALMHHWRYVGHLMGITPPWYPETAADGFRAQYLVMLTEEPKFGPDTEMLTRSFLNTFRPAEDARGLTRVRGNLRYKSQVGHSRFYLGDLHAQCGLPDAGLWRFVPLAHFIPNFARETARRRIPGVAARIDRSHRAARQDFLNKNLEGGEAKFQPVEKLSR
jgi:hypothetical protein